MLPTSLVVTVSGYRTSLRFPYAIPGTDVQLRSYAPPTRSPVLTVLLCTTRLTGSKTRNNAELSLLTPAGQIDHVFECVGPKVCSATALRAVRY
eukprot:3920213-Rhodomonas_salina.2